MSPARDSQIVPRRRSRRPKKQRKQLLKRKARKKEGVSPLVEKYWRQRYDLFARYDQGIKLDEEGWFSVTPEAIAIGHAQRCRGVGVVIDGFAGGGGNAIQFAAVCNHVVAIDIDPGKVALAMHNAKIYGVENFIDFIVGDFFQLAPSLKFYLTGSCNLIMHGESESKGDVVFLSPPWGGPSYKEMKKYSLDLLKPKDGYHLFQVARTISSNMIFYLPKNIDVLQAEELSWLCSPPLDVEIEENFVRGKLKGITVYFGDAALAQLSLRQLP